MKIHLRLALVALAGAVSLGVASVAWSAVIPSPSDDLLLSSTGAVADINGSPSGYDATTPASNLNNGNRDGSYGDGAIAHVSGTSSGAGNYMEVTTTGPITVQEVILFNRTDCCSDRIDANHTKPYTLTIYNGTPSVATTVYTANYTFAADITGTNESGQTLILPSAITGTVFRITQNNADYMNLGELEAYAPEPASLGLLGLGAAGLLKRRKR